MRSSTLLCVIGTIFALAPASPVFGEGDPLQGERLAVELCTRCHDVSPEGAFKQYPPSFASIAVYRSEDQVRARIVFPALHSAMPDVARYLIDARGVDNLVAYITSLEK